MGHTRTGMRMRLQQLPLCCIAVCIVACHGTASNKMTLYKLPSSVIAAFGAACLDGSPPAFYHRPGQKSNRFIIFLEGGGWCSNSTSPGSDDNFESCDKRALTDTGSSTNYNRSEFGGDYGGILSRDPDINPSFAHDHHVFVKYCDGSSFTGYRQGTVAVNGRPLYFRGRANLAAVLDVLQQPQFGLGTAQEVILSGGSAGGLAVYANLDFVTQRLQQQIEGLQVVGFPDTGIFLEGSQFGVDWWKQMQHADRLWGSSAAGNIDEDCLASMGGGEGWRCLFGARLLPHISTKLFALNSDIDMWYSQYVLRVHCTGWKPAPSPPANCTAQELQKMAALRVAWRAAVLPVLSRNGNGGFIDTCSVHEQNVDYCSSQHVANCVGWNVYKAFPSMLTPQQAFEKWYFKQGGRTANLTGSFVTLDNSAFPGGNPTCFSL